MIASLGQMGQWVFDRFVMASGKAHLFIFTLSAASLTNLILDPIFIFGKTAHELTDDGCKRSSGRLHARKAEPAENENRIENQIQF